MDYTDGISLITRIDSNLPTTQQYDNTNKVIYPSWAGKSLQLTPIVYKIGTGDIVSAMSNKQWYTRYAQNTSEWGDPIVSGSNGYTINSNSGVLVVSQDKLTETYDQIEFKFTGTYLDPTLKLSFPVEEVITFSRVMNGTPMTIAVITTLDGNQFKNGEPESLRIKAELLRGVTLDTTDLKYKWQTTTNGEWGDMNVATDKDTITITKQDVPSFAMFRCIITDDDAASTTYNKPYTSDAVSILDMSDPYQAVIESTAGQFFKNKSGSTILICRVYQNGKEVDAKGEELTYTWTKTDSSGTAVSFTPTGVTYGTIVSANKKAISVSADKDVDNKATFFCSVN